MTEVKQAKGIPYAIPSFESIRTENYAYVDKTHFIEMLERESTKYQFLIRPRKFGKSLFLSTLKHYYDICSKDNFQTLFGDLYIGKNPTGKQNSMFVMKFQFSGLNTRTVEKFEISFYEAIRSSIQTFLTEHQFIINEYKKKKDEAWGIKSVRGSIEYAFGIIREFGCKAYVIIDEYDHFANDLIAQGTNLSLEQYKQLIWANGVVRDFYETLKDATQTVVDRIFITGVTPIMLDDVTSGFNISNNLSLDLRYHDILGFNEDEVEKLIDDCGIDRAKITIDRQFLYNGYLFHKDAKNKLYNSTMILYILNQINITVGAVIQLIDYNLKSDYTRIRMLMNKPENTEKLETIIEQGKIESNVIPRFSVEKIHENKNFLSLLYYMGLVTIHKDENNEKPWLKIPNYSIKTMYWEYMEEVILERNPKMSYDPTEILSASGTMAFEEDYLPFFEIFHQKFVSRISTRDLRRFSEKNVKFLLLSVLFQTDYYLPISEPENTEGYIDIYLKRRNDIYKGIKTDWVWEIKYIKQSDAGKEALIAQKKSEALEKLKRYKSSTLFKDRTDVRYIAVVFTGKKEYLTEELVV